MFFEKSNICYPQNYDNIVMNSLGSEPIFLVNDSHIIKPCGEKFENLGIVRDGSSRDKTYEKAIIIQKL